MPFPNEHACRLRDPDDFQDGSFRRMSRKHDGKRYDVIMGRLKGEDTMTEQSMRYPRSEWTESEARKHCRDHNGQSFEPASGQNALERRHFTLDALHVEKREDGKRRIVGHAAVFNQLSEDLGGFREQIAPGAFAEAIEKDDVRALYNHNPDHILGRTVAGTLKLAEDARGLAIEIDPPDTQIARDLLVSIERGDISQMSFGFSIRPNGQDWAKDDDGRVIRTLKRVRLFDVSPVTYPAYPQTDVALRELRGWEQEASNALKVEQERQIALRDLLKRKLDLAI